jgi:hypothetical protein
MSLPEVVREICALGARLAEITKTQQEARDAIVRWTAWGKENDEIARASIGDPQGPTHVEAVYQCQCSQNAIAKKQRIIDALESEKFEISQGLMKRDS